MNGVEWFYIGWAKNFFLVIMCRVPGLASYCCCRRECGEQIGLERSFKVVIKSLFVWLMIIPLATLNGLVWGYVLDPLLGRTHCPQAALR